MPGINLFPFIDMATDINSKIPKLLNPNGVNGNENEIINIIKLEKIPLTPPIII